MPPEPEASRRQTPSERLHEVTMAAIQRPASPPEHTVGLTLNAKGDVQIEVTARGADLDQLVTDVVASFDLLVIRYPRAEAPAGGTSGDKTARAAAAIARARTGG